MESRPVPHACLAGGSWTSLANGLREKSQILGDRRFRLLEFSSEFTELDWCRNGHAGYVLTGEIVLDVEGQLVTFRAGDVINLPTGTRHRHATTKETATLFLIEDVSD